jgi:NADPH:quinone reductase-like Zn-dependent oxidoreductase
MEEQNKGTTNHAVRYDKFGGTDVLYIAELPKPKPKANEVLVRIKAAGINPGEASIREGRLAKQFPSTFPSGEGTDFAGVIEAVGSSVTRFSQGDEVIGFSNERSSHAEYTTVPDNQVITRPAHVGWEQGGGLFVAGTTAYAAVKAVDVKAGETVIVSGAAGGVGSIAVQLAKIEGATVIGIAGEANHQWLKDHDIIPVSHQGDVEQNIITALRGKNPDAFIDTFGKTYVELAIKLGIPANRINTIIDFEAVGKYHVKSDGSAAAGNAKVLAELADMVANGKLEIPIARTYPLSKVKDAYQDLEQRHTRGKIVLVP